MKIKLFIKLLILITLSFSCKNKFQNKPEQENKKYSFTESYNRKPIHYDFTIEPFDYIHDNDMGFAEGNIVKYITRWKYKDGLQDLYKAKTKETRLTPDLPDFPLFIKHET